MFFGNRGFFPASLIAQAREEIPRLLRSWGHEVLVMPESETRYGAVETLQEGQRYANFLRENYGKFDGVILSLPNFGDEYGAVTALKDANVPILFKPTRMNWIKCRQVCAGTRFAGKYLLWMCFSNIE
jgi:L-fucose isomerase-like protein